MSEAAHREQLRKLIRAAKLGEFADAIEALARPCVRLRTRNCRKRDVQRGATRIGGHPDLPAGVEWPRLGGKLLPFLAQVWLPDLAPFDSDKLLPREGALSFFARGRRIRVLHSVGELRPADENELPENEQFRLLGVDLHFALSLPNSESRFIGLDAPRATPGSAARLGSALALPPDIHSRYGNLVWGKYLTWADGQAKQRAGSTHRMLGYEGANTDVEQERDDTLLLELDSDESSEMTWGDAGQLLFLIRRAALEKGDFSKVRIAESL